MPNTHPECTDLGNCRTVSSIVWTCLATLFICTWTCIHPNVPGLGGTFWTRLGRRLGLMLLMIIAPEFIVYWAIKQFACARTFSNKHHVSLVHGFFFNMGGFAKNTDEGLRYLMSSPEPRPESQDPEKGSNASNISSNPVSPSPSPNHIPAIETAQPLSDIERISNVRPETLEGRSRSDALTKGIATLQISWFLAQCIGRAAEGLAITELEIATAAFALLTVVTYGFWWYKPFDVAEPIVLNQAEGEHHEIFQSVHKYKSRNGLVGFLDGILNFLLGTHFDDDDVTDDRIAVPARWSGDANDIPRDFNGVLQLFGLFLGFCFGAIHCAAWQFVFPTLQERWLWRVCSLVIMVIPVVWLLLLLQIDALRVPIVGTWLGSILDIIMLIIAVLYIIARLGLLVLPFTSLRALPPTAYHTVDWLKFIPHFG